MTPTSRKGFAARKAESLFRCGHPKTPRNSQTTGNEAPRCRQCYRERLRRYMRERYHSAGPALVLHDPWKDSAAP